MNETGFGDLAVIDTDNPLQLQPISVVVWDSRARGAQAPELSVTLAAASSAMQPPLPASAALDLGPAGEQHQKCLQERLLLLIALSALLAVGSTTPVSAEVLGAADVHAAASVLLCVRGFVAAACAAAAPFMSSNLADVAERAWRRSSDGGSSGERRSSSPLCRPPPPPAAAVVLAAANRPRLGEWTRHAAGGPLLAGVQSSRPNHVM